MVQCESTRGLRAVGGVDHNSVGPAHLSFMILILGCWHVRRALTPGLRCSVTAKWWSIPLTLTAVTHLPNISVFYPMNLRKFEVTCEPVGPLITVRLNSVLAPVWGGIIDAAKSVWIVHH